METQSEQPDALRQRMKRFEQSLPGRNKCWQVRYSVRKAFRAGDQGEIAELHLESDGPAADFRTRHPVPCVAGDSLELAREAIAVAQILVERPFGADRFVRPVGLDLALVDAAADSPIPLGR